MCHDQRDPGLWEPMGEKSCRISWDSFRDKFNHQPSITAAKQWMLTQLSWPRCHSWTLSLYLCLSLPAMHTVKMPSVLSWRLFVCVCVPVCVCVCTVINKLSHTVPRLPGSTWWLAQLLLPCSTSPISKSVPPVKPPDRKLSSLFSLINTHHQQ